MDKLSGIITKKIADTFIVTIKDESLKFVPRGKMKLDGLYVGDEVLVCTQNMTIEKVFPRKNLLVRPPLANLTQLFIIIAKVPKPDFLVVDKLLLFCFLNNIKPFIIVNKIDLEDKTFTDYVKKAYSGVSELLFISVKTKKNLPAVKKALNGQISALAGQSAVGKSALLQVLFPKAVVQIGELSKILRGRQTTRHSELFKLAENTFLADTSGFSKLSEKFLPIEHYDLRYYYPDFLTFHNNCKYKSCTHTNEDESECGVKKAVSEGLLDKDRYIRYNLIYKGLKENKPL